jgi:hypothetical protein
MLKIASILACVVVASIVSFEAQAFSSSPALAERLRRKLCR